MKYKPMGKWEISILSPSPVRRGDGVRSITHSPKVL